MISKTGAQLIVRPEWLEEHPEGLSQVMNRTLSSQEMHEIFKYTLYLKGGHTHNHKRNAGYRKVWRKKHMRKYFRYFELAKASHENNND